MKLNRMITTAAMASVMALGFQGPAFAGGTPTVTGSTISGNRAGAASGHTSAHVLLGDGSVRPVRQAKSQSAGGNSISNGSGDPQNSLLLPAVQKAREAAR